MGGEDLGGVCPATADRFVRTSTGFRRVLHPRWKTKPQVIKGAEVAIDTKRSASSSWSTDLDKLLGGRSPLPRRGEKVETCVVDRRRPISFIAYRQGPNPRRRKIEIDVEHWPLVCQTFNGKQTDFDINHYIMCINQIHDRREPFVTLVRLINFRGDVSHIKRIAQWMRDHNGSSMEYSLGNAIVIETKALRMLASVAGSIPFDVPHFVTEDYGEACEWLAERLRDVGLGVPKFPSEHE